MQSIGLISTAVLSLTFGITAPAHAQGEHQGNKQDRSQQQERHEPSKHSQQHAQQQPSGGARQQAQHDRQPRQQQARGKQYEHAPQQRNHPQGRTQRQQVERSAWLQHRSQHWNSDHRTWQQRGGYNGYRIPDGRYRGYFGPEHGFRIHGRPFLVVGGYPRFQYSGYWFSLVDPWPEYWDNNWYDTDDVYVAYVDDGYYLFNRRHPRSGIAISISM